MELWKLNIELYDDDGGIECLHVYDDQKLWTAVFVAGMAADVEPRDDHPSSDLALRRAFDFLESQTDQVLINFTHSTGHPKLVKLPLEDVTLEAVLSMASIPRWYVYRKLRDKNWHRRSGPFYDEEHAVKKYDKCKTRIKDGGIRFIQGTDNASMILKEEWL